MTFARILKHYVNDLTIIQMPIGSRVLCVGLDPNERLAIWVWTPQHEGGVEDRTFEIFATGHDVPMTHYYHGTIHDGNYVLHVFEHNPLGRSLA